MIGKTIVHRLLALGMLLSSVLCPLSSGSQTYVEATRADLGLHVAQAVMPESLFTNCVFWMDANAGAYNAGATNFFIPGLSTNRNDAIQPVINSQPTVTTNGWSFDGVDDDLLISTTALDTFGMWVNLSNLATGPDFLIGVLWHDGGFGSLTVWNGSTSVGVASGLPSGQWIFVSGAYTGTAYRFFINGTFAKSVTMGKMNTTFLFNTSTVGREFLGRGGSVFIFNRSFTDAEMTALYNATKGEYL